MSGSSAQSIQTYAPLTVPVQKKKKKWSLEPEKASKQKNPFVIAS